MNCNCCNCSNNNEMSCEDGKLNKIKIYGTLVNATLDPSLKDDRDEEHDPCKADNWPSNVSEEGHNSAIAYAYQLHDGRFRQDDDSMAEWERFQDEINKRVTNIEYDPETNTTTVEGDTHIWNLYIRKGDQWIKIGDAASYDDSWLKDIIGTTPSGEQNASELLQGDFDEESGDIISYIRLLKQQICNLQEQINELIQQGGSCLWVECNGVGGAGVCPKNNKKVYGPGFYDTEVTNP